MGDYADMMLDGTCCQSCGMFLEGDFMGFPVICPDCQKEMDVDLHGDEIKKPFKVYFIKGQKQIIPRDFAKRQDARKSCKQRSYKKNYPFYIVHPDGTEELFVWKKKEQA